MATSPSIAWKTPRMIISTPAKVIQLAQPVVARRPWDVRRRDFGPVRVSERKVITISSVGAVVQRCSPWSGGDRFPASSAADERRPWSAGGPSGEDTGEGSRRANRFVGDPGQAGISAIQPGLNARSAIELGLAGRTLAGRWVVCR